MGRAERLRQSQEPVGDADQTKIYDPDKDTTSRDAAALVAKKLNSYAQGNHDGGECIIELHGLMQSALFGVMEIEIPEMRGKWVSYVYDKYCKSIPWEFMDGMKTGKLLDKLSTDPVWNEAHPGFVDRVKNYRKTLADQQSNQSQQPFIPEV